MLNSHVLGCLDDPPHGGRIVSGGEVGVIGHHHRASVHLGTPAKRTTSSHHQRSTIRSSLLHLVVGPNSASKKRVGCGGMWSNHPHGDGLPTVKEIPWVRSELPTTVGSTPGSLTDASRPVVPRSWLPSSKAPSMRLHKNMEHNATARGVSIEDGVNPGPSTEIQWKHEAAVPASSSKVCVEVEKWVHGPSDTQSTLFGNFSLLSPSGVACLHAHPHQHHQNLHRQHQHTSAITIHALLKNSQLRIHKMGMSRNDT